MAFRVRNALCVASLLSAAALAAPLRADDWPQWLGPQRDGVWRETGLLDGFPKEGPKVFWRTAISLGYAGPAVAGRRVFITDFVPADESKVPGSGFSKGVLKGHERVLCLDECKGRVLWKHEYPCTYEIGYPAGPRTTPVVAADKVYTLGTMGDLYCLQTATGDVVWSKNLVKDLGGKLGIWGAAAHPLVDGDKLICLVGAKDGVVMAFDKDTGQERWRSLSAEQPGYSPPMIYTFGGKRTLVVWHPEAVNGLDPETGKPYWSVPFSLTQPSRMSIATPRADGNRLFVTAFYDGPLMLEVAGEKARVLWKGKTKTETPDKSDGLHGLMSTPVLRDGYIYGVCSYGELRCLKQETGERVWSTMEATTRDGEPLRWANAFLTPHEDRFFLFNELGDLIMARLTPKGYEELSRAHLLEPTNGMAQQKRKVLWSHPAFADKCCFARNDKEIICVSLAAE
jgi:outer membrane protein assembly factor BamB